MRKAVVALTPQERRRLREIEQQLTRDDPEFVASMGDHDHPRASGPSPRSSFWWVLAAVAISVAVALPAGISYAAILMLFMIAASAFMKVGSRGRW